MQFPTLTPLQSRLAACLGTSILLVVLYFSLSPSHFAYAAELDSILNEDHNHHRIAFGHELNLAGDLDWGDDSDQDYDREGTADYQAAFQGISRSIIGRAPLDTVSLNNNLPNTLNIDAGETQYYVFEQDQLSSGPGTSGSELPTNVTGSEPSLKRKRSLPVDDELESLEERDEESLFKRQSSTTVYLTANTCLQPELNDNKTGSPGQPTIYYSLSDGNQKPSSDNNDGSIQLEQGYAGIAIPNVSGNLYISISAPALPNNTFTGPWSYQIAASIDTYYHYFNNETAFLWTVDTDSNSSLLMTYNLTDQNGSDPAVIAERKAWMNLNSDPPFSIYIFNNSSPKIDGIKNSYCGLSKLNMEFMQINTSMSDRGVGSNPKQQFYIQSLLPGQTYFSVLAYGGGNTSGNAAIVAGGGQVWQPNQFSTKSAGNCRVIFDLPFCDAVAYAVPTNPNNETLSNLTTLSLLYDTNAENLYTNFSLSLQQVPCNTTSTGQYSLTSTCNDCARDYKTWLCAVTIPRCLDFSTDLDFLAPRAIGSPFPNGSTLADLNSTQASQVQFNSSRNPLIDSSIHPGPYKELLPCQELCFDMVQSCPTSMGFKCPEKSALWAPLGMSYGEFDPRAILGANDILNISGLSCNYLGVDWPTLGNGADRMGARSVLWVLTLVAMAWIAV